MINVPVLISVKKCMVNVLKFLTLYSITFLIKILLLMQLFLKIHRGMATSVDVDQIAPKCDLGLHCLHMLFCQNLCC